MTPLEQAELEDKLERYEKGLRAIADYNSRNDAAGCRCGHRMSMCWKVQAEMWCGGAGHAGYANHLLGDCKIDPHTVCWHCIQEERDK